MIFVFEERKWADESPTKVVVKGDSPLNADGKLAEFLNASASVLGGVGRWEVSSDTTTLVLGNGDKMERFECAVINHEVHESEWLDFVKESEDGDVIFC